MSEFVMTTEQILCLMARIVVASICGMVIGWEREKRLKSAGLRTHMLVAMAASLMMIISKYGFLDVVYLSSVQVDVSRMASGVVQAIGFLGAGVIFVKRDNIIGVTTAAGLWATVGIGLSIGCGFYVIGISCTILMLIIQYVMHIQEHKSFSTNTGSITINLTKHGLTLNDVKAKLDAIHITIRNITMTHTMEGDVVLKASIICSRSASVPGIMEDISKSGIIDDIEMYTAD